MRRTALIALWVLALPAVAEAQPRLLVGAGLSNPVSDLESVAESGYHLALGVEVGIPTLPVSLRLDGSYHAMGSSSAGVDGPEVLGGALNVVFALPGVGLTPYLLGGVGRYRLTDGLLGPGGETTERGFQLGFGVNLGSLAFGGFAEIRYVQVNSRGAAPDTKYVPLTIGVRL